MLALAAVLSLTEPGFGPALSSNLTLSAPIKTWDEAAPLGNGEMGALVWGEGNTVKLSLDRGDIWDLRAQGLTQSPAWTYAHLLELVRDNNQDQIVHLFDSPYDAKTPTKLPGIRVELKFASDYVVKQFGLSLSTATARFDGEGGGGTFCLPHENPVIVGHLTVPLVQLNLHASSAVNELGFVPAHYGKDSSGSWVIQDGDQGLQYVVFAATRAVKDGTEIAVSFATNAHNGVALREARRLATEAIKKGYETHAKATENWWRNFWSVSGLRVPDEKVQAEYDLAMYLYGAGARRGSPPIPLQGLWTADGGTLPPWKGDFHHDLNTQLTYWPFLASGHWEEGRGLLDFLWSQVHTYEQFAANFYEKPGAAIPGVAALDGSPLGGWPMYSLSPTMGLWISMAFVDYWRYSGDTSFLRKRAYPFCRDLAVCTVGLLHENPSGNLVLPASSSPEIHDEELTAWLKPNSNFDLSVLKAFFQGMTEMAATLKQEKDEVEWKKIASKLEDFHISPKDGGLRVDANQDLEESHRHFSHLMSIHPFGQINVEGSDADRKVIDASLARIDKLGTNAWCGYSFAWMACIDARTGRADAALKNLDIFANAFVLRNGFHANGDQSGKGYSGFTYRPVTLEGNFAAAQAVHEMLLQSWGGKVRVFPATPSAWADASFSDLRTEGGFIVSAVRNHGKTVSITVTATRAGKLRLVVGNPMSWTTPTGTAHGANLEVELKSGQKVTGTG